MGWLTGCHVGLLGGFQGVGDACWRKIGVCFGLLTHMLFAFCHELFLHVVFAEAFDFDSNTIFALICIFLFFWFVCCFWPISDRFD